MKADFILRWNIMNGYNWTSSISGDVIELEWKKRDLNNTITLWNAQLRDLGRAIIQYQDAIDR
jgi:hypothetical protein